MAPTTAPPIVVMIGPAANTAPNPGINTVDNPAITPAMPIAPPVKAPAMAPSLVEGFTSFVISESSFVFLAIIEISSVV